MTKESTTTSSVNTSDREETILGFDSIEFYVGNAYQTAHYFRTGFGFQILSTSGLDTGACDSVSLLLGGSDIRFIVTSALCPGIVAEHVHRHGDSVRDIALQVSDLDSVFERAVSKGAEPIMRPSPVDGSNGGVRRGVIGTPSDIVHSLVERTDDLGFSVPNSKMLRTANKHQLGFEAIDHVAIAVGMGELDRWADFYCSAFGFETTHEETTATELTAMRSKVVENPSHTVKFPIVEPAPGRHRSQVEDFLHYHNGSGVQHVALSCSDIEMSLRGLRERGIEFLNVPDTYYDMLPARFGTNYSQLEPLRTSRVLVDRDKWGDLLQTFSKPITGKPTLFFELVQRKGARGFGSGNIKALFEALEREQGLRTDWARG